MKSLRYWNEAITLAGIEIECDFFGVELVIEDGRITKVLREGEEIE